jgi:NAD(P)-dependent dehydrogenase (short-subunit alcohol dehydrogenase family)
VGTRNANPRSGWQRAPIRIGPRGTNLVFGGAVESALGGIDILANNAGVATVTGGILNESPEVWDTTMATPLDATFLMSNLLLVGAKPMK